MPILGTHNVYAIMLPNRSHYAYTNRYHTLNEIESQNIISSYPNAIDSF